MIIEAHGMSKAEAKAWVKKELGSKNAKSFYPPNHYKRWTTIEIKLVADSTKTDVELAEQLGRSEKAIIGLRAHIRFCKRANGK